MIISMCSHSNAFQYCTWQTCNLVLLDFAMHHIWGSPLKFSLMTTSFPGRQRHRQLITLHRVLLAPSRRLSTTVADGLRNRPS